MPPADPKPTTSGTRRMLLKTGALFGAGAAISAIGAATGASASAPAHSDAALIAACADYHAARAEEAHLVALPLEVNVDPQMCALLVDRMVPALEAAATLPARTLAGLQAKAALIQADLPRAVDGFELTPDTLEVRVVLSLAADILRGGQA